MRWECRERFPRNRLQRKPLVNDPGMHRGTCVTHVAIAMQRWREKTFPAFPAHAQPAILHIWQEAMAGAYIHGMSRTTTLVAYGVDRSPVTKKDLSQTHTDCSLIHTVHTFPVIFIQTSLKFVAMGPIVNPSIGSENGLMPNTRHTIIWINVDQWDWRHTASLGNDGKIHSCIFCEFYQTISKNKLACEIR